MSKDKKHVRLKNEALFETPLLFKMIIQGPQAIFMVLEKTPTLISDISFKLHQYCAGMGRRGTIETLSMDVDEGILCRYSFAYESTACEIFFGDLRSTKMFNRNVRSLVDWQEVNVFKELKTRWSKGLLPGCPIVGIDISNLCE